MMYTVDNLLPRYTNTVNRQLVCKHKLIKNIKQFLRTLRRNNETLHFYICIKTKRLKHICLLKSKDRMYTFTMDEN